MQKSRLFSILTSFVILMTMISYVPKLSEPARAVSANDLVSIAKAEIGNTYSKYTRALYAIDGEPDGGYAYPWCAAFVAYCAKKAGLSEIRQTASCIDMYYQSGGTKHDVRTNKSYVPQPGDLVFYQFPSVNSRELNHVEIVTGYSSGTIYTVTGNSGQDMKMTERKVCTRERSYNENVHYLITPNYNGQTSGDGTISDYPRPTVNLKRGNKGDQVKWVQQTLMKLGYDLSKYGTDGDFGGETENAVIKFQKDNGLDPDGIVGPKTVSAIVAKLSAADPPTPVPPEYDTNPYPQPTRNLWKGHSGEDVMWLQWALKHFGKNIGSTGIDGKFGAATEAALIAFQEEHGLDPDGIAGPKTIGKINELMAAEPGNPVEPVEPDDPPISGSVEDTIYLYLVQKLGLTKAAACGVMGNLQLESNFDPTLIYKESNGTHSYGLCQWNDGESARFQALRDFSGGNWKSLNKQLDFMKSELEQQPDYYGLNDLKTITTNTVYDVIKAAEIWEKKFERCKGDSYLIRENYALAHWKKRGGSPAVWTFNIDALPFGNVDSGDKSYGTKWVQTILQNLQYNIGTTGVDGDFGSATENAVKLFQKNNGLGADGIAGDKTKAKMVAVYKQTFTTTTTKITTTTTKTTTTTTKTTTTTTRTTTKAPVTTTTKTTTKAPVITTAKTTTKAPVTTTTKATTKAPVTTTTKTTTKAPVTTTAKTTTKAPVTTTAKTTTKAPVTTTTKTTTKAPVTTSTTAATRATITTIKAPGTTEPKTTTTASVTTSEETVTTTAADGDDETLLGDVNGDGSVDLKDVVTMRRALVGGWDDLEFDETAADVNEDGSFDLKDVVYLRRYLAGGWNIVLN